MHKIIRRTLIALFSVICLVCGSLFIAACADDDKDGGEKFYQVELSFDSEKGSVTKSPSQDAKGYAKDEDVTIEFVAYFGYEVSSVKVNGSAVTYTGNSYTFAVTKNTTVEVQFTDAEDLFNGRTIYNFAEKTGFKLNDGVVTDLSGSDKDGDEQPYGNYTYDAATKTLTIGGSGYVLQDNNTLVVDTDIYYMTGASYDVSVGESATKHFCFTLLTVSMETEGDDVIPGMSESTIVATFGDVTFGGVAADLCVYEIGEWDDNVITAEYAAGDIYTERALINLGENKYTSSNCAATVYDAEGNYKAVIAMDSLNRQMSLYKKDGSSWTQIKADGSTDGSVRKTDVQTEGQDTPEVDDDDVYTFVWTIVATNGTQTDEYTVNVNGAVYAETAPEDNYDNAELVVTHKQSYTEVIVVAGGNYEITINYTNGEDIKITNFREKVEGSETFSTVDLNDNEKIDATHFALYRRISSETLVYNITLTGSAGNYSATVAVASVYTTTIQTEHAGYNSSYFILGVTYECTEIDLGGGNKEYEYAVTEITTVEANIDDFSTPLTDVTVEKQIDGTFKVNGQKGGDPVEYVFTIVTEKGTSTTLQATAYIADEVTVDGYKITFAVAEENASSVVGISKDGVDYEVTSVSSDLMNDFDVTAEDDTQIYYFDITYVPGDGDPASATISVSGTQHKTGEIEVTASLDGADKVVKLTVDLVDHTIEEITEYDGETEIDVNIQSDKKSAYISLASGETYLFTLAYDDGYTATLTGGIVTATATINDGNDTDLTVYLSLNGESKLDSADDVKMILDGASACDVQDVEIGVDGLSFTATVDGVKIKFENLTNADGYKFDTKYEQAVIAIISGNYSLNLIYDEIQEKVTGALSFAIMISELSGADGYDSEVMSYTAELSGMDTDTMTLTTDFGEFTITNFQNAEGVFTADIALADSKTLKVLYADDVEGDALGAGSDTQGWIAVVICDAEGQIEKLAAFGYIYKSEGYWDESYFVPYDPEDESNYQVSVNAAENKVTVTMYGSPYILNIVGNTLTVTPPEA